VEVVREIKDLDTVSALNTTNELGRKEDEKNLKILNLILCL
jgi:hypothetical protein